MTQRTYKIVDPPQGILDQQIWEFRDDGEADRPYLSLWRSTPGSTVSNTVKGLQKAYQGGREDRSEEILGDAGLARATSAAGLHGPQGVLGDAVLGQAVGCKCGRFEGSSIADWQQHLAYEILQAAARLP